MTCPFDDQRTLHQELGKLPKGSSCQEWKDTPARSSYWRDDTDSVTRCAKWATGGDGDDTAPPDKDGPPYRDEDGNFTDDRMENAFYWAGQLRGWMIDGPNAGLRGTYCVEIQAGQAILVADKESWDESGIDAIVTSLREHGFPDIPPKNVRELDDEWRVFIKPTDERLKSNYAENWKHIDPECTDAHPDSDGDDSSEGEDGGGASEFPEFEISIENGRLREMTEPFKRFPRKTGGAHFTVDSEGAIDFIGMNEKSTVMYETDLILAKADSASVENAGETVSFPSVPLAQAISGENMTEQATLSAEGGELHYSAGDTSETFELEATEQGMPSFPDVDIGVNTGPFPADKFKKRVRALSKINDDSAVVVFEDDEVYMVTEGRYGKDNDDGERDRARAELTDGARLPSGGNDRYAVPIAYEFLRDASLAPYTPKSTDMRLSVYELENEEDGDLYIAPIELSYEQRGGFVKLTIAPRIATDDNEIGDWDLSSPACPVHSVADGLELAEPLESGEEVPEIDGMNLHDGDSVIWTFPKADGCRCGAQAMQYEQLAAELDVPVFGIAATSPEDLQDMAERYDLEALTLISDPEGQLASEFGVEFNENDRLERTTMFVRDGRITDVSEGVSPPELSQPNSEGCPIKTASAPVMLAQKNESKLYESIEHPSVYVITGSRGSGKSALAHRLGEEMAERDDLVPVAVGVPKHIREKYPPEWVHVDDMDEAPGDSVTIIDEAYLKFHARQSQKKENLKMGAYINTSRHCNRTVIFVSQNSGHLDKMAVSEADGLLIKEPGTFHMEFERKQVRDITERAKESYDQLPSGLDNREYVYAVNDDFEGLVENDKPSWYDDEVSKSYGSACQSASDGKEASDD